MRKYVFLLVIAPIIILLDQWTKNMILHGFYLGEVHPIVAGFFDITHTHNTGAAFGFLAHANPAFRVPFFILTPVIALGVVLYMLKKTESKQVLFPLALSFIFGGAVGNLIDRVRLGYVVDFFLFHWNYQYQYPAFNVADIAICIGVGLLLIDLFVQNKKA